MILNNIEFTRSNNNINVPKQNIISRTLLNKQPFDCITFSGGKHNYVDPQRLAEELETSTITTEKLCMVIRDKYGPKKPGELPDVSSICRIGTHFARNDKMSKALAIFQCGLDELGDSPDRAKYRADILSRMADTHKTNGNYPMASHIYFNILPDICSDPDFPELRRAEILKNMADIEMANNKHERAVLLCKTALNDMCDCFMEEDQITDDLEIGYNPKKLAPATDITKGILEEVIHIYQNHIPIPGRVQEFLSIYAAFNQPRIEVAKVFLTLKTRVSPFKAKDLIKKLRSCDQENG